VERFTADRAALPLPSVGMQRAGVLALFLAAAAAPLAATTYQVGPGRPHTTLGALFTNVDLAPGDVVEVDGNVTYAGGIVMPSADGGAPGNPVTIRGLRVANHRPILSGSTNTIEIQADHVVMEGFEVTGGSFRCIYHHSHGVTIRDTLVHDCAAHGILGADQGSGSLTLEHVEVHHCGNGTSQHAIYMATNEEDYPGAVFRMQHCWVHDQNGGNAVKSRAERNEIYYNWIEGTEFHLLELIGPDPAGGVPAGLAREDSDVVGNVLVHHNTFSFVRIGGDGTGESAGRYRFVNNTFVRAADAGAPPGSAVFRCFDALESVEMHNNVFYSVASGGGLRILRDLEADWTQGSQRIAGQNNWLETGSVDLPSQWTATITGANPGFATLTPLDPRPVAGSPLLNAATSTPTPPAGFSFPNPHFPPIYHPPVHVVLTSNPPPPRPLAPPLDVGAYEQPGLFADGFESGGTGAWSGKYPP
jgi:parallel beta helix pectate lyase-like protein